MDLDQGAQDVVLALMLLLKENVDMGTAKKLMMQKNFIDRLKTFKLKTVDMATLKALKNLTIKMTFNPDWQSQYTNGLRLLCMWVLKTQKDAIRLRKIKKQQRAVFEQNVLKLYEKK